MEKDTGGNIIIQKPRLNCDCGLTGGCKKCIPRDSFIGSITDQEAEGMKKKVGNFKKRFNKDFEKRHKKLFPPKRYYFIIKNYDPPVYRQYR